MKVSRNSKELIADVWETIELFSKDFKVYAIYSLREYENVSDFVDVEEPNRSEAETEEYCEELI